MMNDKTQAESEPDTTAPDRTSERGDVAEPDAPTATEENEGLSTILDGEPVAGVQDDASEK
ncbi:MAG: hypothetical protein DMF64_15600 [Acidobacteria bacterium]|nr:MAG: hypothetical protein DMF64_15600 [Acidobacteriota bacterium]